MMPDALKERRIVRIIALLVVLLVSGTMFAYLHMGEKEEIAPVAGEGEYRAVEKEEAGPILPLLRDYPAPDTFDHFVYHGEVSKKVSGTCKDYYYTILIFPADTDYRAEPRNAFHNRAERCIGGTFSVDVSLPSPPYENGSEYYIVRADQREEGRWYDAY